MYSDMDARLAALEQRLGVEFKDRRLLRQAITHRSYLNEHLDAGPDNEILEYLGDAVLELVVREHLVRRFGKIEREGQLEHRCKAVVSNENLGHVGETLGLDKIILISRGYRAAPRGTREHRYILACTVEALFGALHLDQGIGACRLLADILLHTSLSAALARFEDPKSDLLQLVQERWRVTPYYRVLQNGQPNERRPCRVGVFIGMIKVAEGEGPSRKDASFAAAKTALTTIDSWEGRLGKRVEAASLNETPQKEE